MPQKGEQSTPLKHACQCPGEVAVVITLDWRMQVRNVMSCQCIRPQRAHPAETLSFLNSETPITLYILSLHKDSPWGIIETL